MCHSTSKREQVTTVCSSIVVPQIMLKEAVLMISSCNASVLLGGMTHCLGVGYLCEDCLPQQCSQLGELSAAETNCITCLISLDSICWLPGTHMFDWRRTTPVYRLTADTCICTCTGTCTHSIYIHVHVVCHHVVYQCSMAVLCVQYT